MGYSFTDLGAEGCCRSLNALFIILADALVITGARSSAGMFLNQFPMDISGLAHTELSNDFLLFSKRILDDWEPLNKQLVERSTFSFI